jgi:hypothetical protein
MTDAVKNIPIKFIGSNRPAEQLGIEPGTTVRDVLSSLGLAGSGYHLIDPAKPEAVFNASDNLYARVEDGDMLAVTAKVDAGHEVLA